MLVVRRRNGESLLIGDCIEVEVLEIAGSQVKLGIKAPREISVLRKEIYLTIEENRTATSVSGDAMLKLVETLGAKHSR